MMYLWFGLKGLRTFLGRRLTNVTSVLYLKNYKIKNKTFEVSDI